MDDQRLILEINVGDSLTKTAEIKQSLNQLIELRKQLVEEVKKGGADEAKALEAVNVAIRTQQQEYRTQTKIIDGYVAQKKTETNTSNLANNSIQQNRDLLKQLTAQYIQLKNPSLAATNQIKELSDTLKKQEGVIGDTRRNVGNYFNEFAKGIPVLGTIIDPLKNISKGFSDSGFSAQGFSAAFSAGIPLIIGAVEGLITIMQKFDSVTEGIEDNMKGVNQSFDFFVGHANDGSLSDLITGMGKAYDAGVKLSQVMRQLAEAQDFQRVTDAQANKEVEALLLKSKDRTKDANDRIAFLDEASKKEEENLKQNIALSEQQVRLAEEEFKRVIEAGLNDDKAKKSLNDANVALINQQRESGNLQEKILNRRNALLDEIAQAEDKQNAKSLAAAKKLADEQEAIRQKNLDNEKQVAIEQGKLEDEHLKRLKDETDEAFKIRQDAYKDQLDLQNRTSAEFLKSQEETAKREIEIQKKVADERRAIAKSIIDVAETTANGLIDTISAVAQAEGAGAEVSKAIAFTKIAISEAIAIANAIEGATAFGASTGPGAIGAIPAAIITLVGVTLANVAQAIALLSTDTPVSKFARGGSIDIDGKPHSQGGTPIHVNGRLVAEAEEGEGLFVMKRDAYQQIDKLSAWNQLHGGVSWGNATGFAALGGNIPTGDGGFATRNSSGAGISSADMKAALRSAMQEMPEITVSVVEIDRVSASRRRSIGVSEA